MAEPVGIDFEAWPACSHCLTPWVVRRCITLGDGNWEWVWQRDCKHKAAPRLATRDSEERDD
jgi:hypothetical protein